MNQPKRQPPAPSAGVSSYSRLRSARPSHSYQLLREVLLTYLSSILLDSVLDRAMQTRGLSPETVSAAQLGEVTGDIMVGLRLFVPEAQLPKLMLELVEVLEGTA